MPPLPRKPHKLSLGTLETEILEIIWQHDGATAKEIHDQILADPDRELTYASVSTVLKRLTNKGWLERLKQSRSFVWRATLTQREAQVLQAHEQLQKLLKVSNPDLIAAFANELDHASADKFEALAQQLKSVRRQRELSQQSSQPDASGSASDSGSDLGSNDGSNNGSNNGLDNGGASTFSGDRA